MRMHELASVAIKVIGAYFLACAAYDVATLVSAQQFDDTMTAWVYLPAVVWALTGLAMIWGTKECLFVMNVPVPEATAEESADETPDDSN